MPNATRPQPPKPTGLPSDFKAQIREALNRLPSPHDTERNRVLEARIRATEATVEHYRVIAAVKFAADQESTNDEN